MGIPLTFLMKVLPAVLRSKVINGTLDPDIRWVVEDKNLDQMKIMTIFAAEYFRR